MSNKDQKTCPEPRHLVGGPFLLSSPLIWVSQIGVKLQATANPNLELTFSGGSLLIVRMPSMCRSY